MNDLEDGKEVFAIASLPVGRSDSVNYSLELVFDRQRFQCQFLYGGEPIRMSGRCKETNRYEGSTERKSRKYKKFSDAKWIPCDQLAYWLKYPPKCYDNTDAEFGQQSYQSYKEKGFTFDADTNTWRNYWYYHKITGAYHTTHRETIEITLDLDLKNRTGSYIYSSCSETAE